MRRATKRRAKGSRSRASSPAPRPSRSSGIGIGKQADQAVGEADAGAAVERARAAIAVDESVAAGIARIARKAREFPGVAQAQIESLAGDRVQGLRGVADGEAVRPCFARAGSAAPAGMRCARPLR